MVGTLDNLATWRVYPPGYENDATFPFGEDSNEHITAVRGGGGRETNKSMRWGNHEVMLPTSAGDGVV